MICDQDMPDGDMRQDGIRVDVVKLITDHDFAERASIAKVDVYFAACRVMAAFQECVERNTFTPMHFKTYLGHDALFEALYGIYVDDEGTVLGDFMVPGYALGRCHFFGPMFGGK